MMNIIRIALAAIVLLTIPVETLAAMPSANHDHSQMSARRHRRRR